MYLLYLLVQLLEISPSGPGLVGVHGIQGLGREGYKDRTLCLVADQQAQTTPTKVVKSVQVALE